ncbi:MAG TPA: SRPBCC family protein [Acidobacteriaceae bacterium]|nr:SRPBCC family protein [Acidobacteriaceae bacterium]
MSATATETTKGYELKITRVFDAPRELVWKAWTDPEMMKQWKGPRGFKVTEHVSAHGPGERWHSKMEGKRPGSEELARMGQHGVVKEMRPPELLVFTFAWDDRSSVGLPESPFKENVVTIRLEERGDKTVMHFTQAPFATESERDGHGGGWNSSFDRFAEFMLAEQPGRTAAAEEVPSELHLRRYLAAPRQMVFDAWTKPEMVRQWWGPKGFTNPVCEVDARAGGEIRIHMQGPDGTVYPMTGRFVEFYPPYRFHFTSGPVNKEGKPILETWTSVFFEEKDGGTEMIVDVHVTMSTPEATMPLKGMREGWSQMLEKLAAFVGGRRM